MDAICDHLAYMSMGDIQYLMINLPPRLSKSTIVSVMWPTWDWINTPWRQWLTGSYAMNLAQRDCLKARKLIDSKWYQDRWSSSFRFSFDNKLKRQYSNDKGGHRITVSPEAGTTGEGGNFVNLDDPHNAREAESDAIRNNTLDWFDNAFQNRMNDQNKDGWCITGQRTHENDLFKHIAETQDMSKVVHLILPNEYDPKRKCVTFLPKTKEKIFTDPRQTKGHLLIPKRLNAERSAVLKKTMGDKYALQYQQDPRASSGNILKRDMWKEWEGEPPDVDQIITVWDTAYGTKQTNDYSARTDWGIFKHKEVVISESGKTSVLPERNCAILIGAWRGRVPFYDLKKKALQHYKAHKPDYTLIEKKVSGISLIQEFKRLGIRGIRGVSIDHGGRLSIDLVERVNIISPMFEDGCVYYLNEPWAQEVIDEAAAFPNATHDDYVSTITMAVQWARRRGELKLWEDERDDDTVRLFKKNKASIYG